MLLNLNLKLVSLLHYIAKLVGKENILYYRADIFGENQKISVHTSPSDSE